jgi:signal recognition particle GTPase
MCDHHQKEAVVLKEEVRRLQVEKYETEKLNRELAHKLEQQAHSKRVFISQLSEIEQKYRSIEENFSEVTDQLARLDANVNAAVKLNKKLMYVNSHQSCQVATYEKELQLKAVEIVSLNADLANKEMGTTQSHGKVTFWTVCVFVNSRVNVSVVMY